MSALQSENVENVRTSLEKLIYFDVMHEWETRVGIRSKRGDGCPHCRKEKSKTGSNKKKD